MACTTPTALLWLVTALLQRDGGRTVGRVASQGHLWCWPLILRLQGSHLTRALGRQEHHQARNVQTVKAVYMCTWLTYSHFCVVLAKGRGARSQGHAIRQSAVGMLQTIPKWPKGYAYPHTTFRQTAGVQYQLRQHVPRMYQCFMVELVGMCQCPTPFCLHSRLV